jgi:hypothetical protein
MRELIDQYNKILNETDKLDLINKLLSEDNGETVESGYSSIMNTFRGLRPNIKKITILTAENPHGEKHSDEFNKNANFKLERFLSSGFIPYKKIKGSYGSKENSFILFNIPKSTAIYIGDKYNQESIIYGETGQTEDGDILPMSFEMIGTDKSNPKDYSKVLGKTDVFVNRKNPEDFYSEINGRKFVLPFYDVVDKFVGKDKKTYDLIKNYDKSKWDGGKVEPTSQKIKLAEEHLNELSERSMNTVGSTSYNLRGRIRKLIGG